MIQHTSETGNSQNWRIAKSTNVDYWLTFADYDGIIQDVYSHQNGGENVGYSYNKLWKILIDRKMTKKDLRDKTKLTSTTIAKMGKEQPVSLDVLGRICAALEVNIGDIVDYIPETKN